MNAPVELSVIIVNYNTVDLLRRCLGSLYAQEGPSLEVFVVDNASTDQSVGMIRRDFPRVALMANSDNVGFARANNQALKACRGRYVYFLNPDTEVARGALEIMVSHMESHPRVGLAGTALVYPDGTRQSSVEKRYPGQRYAGEELDHLDGDIAWVMGASMITRRHIMAQMSGFDEKFFLYGEDLDLCLTIRKAGWSIGFIPEARVIHWGGQSERNHLPKDVFHKKLLAELIFYEKHYTAHTVRAIKRARLMQALWRIITLNLALPLSRDRKACRMKLDKYWLTWREMI